MTPESEKTQAEICREFESKKRKVTRFGWFFFIPLFLMVVGGSGLGIGPLPGPWILGIGIMILLIAAVLGNLDWSCPACGKLFRKAGQRIRFCPYCGVTLLDGAERYRVSDGSETGAEHAVGGNGG